MTLLGMPIADVIFIVVSFCSMFYAAVNGAEWLNSHFHFWESRKTKLEERLDSFDSKLDGIATRLDKNEDDTQALKNASISRIKGKIVDRHREYMALGTIDYKTLDYLQQQFKAYEKMGGNSYVHDLIHDLEGLPLSDTAPIAK